jgi:hypothetical protein
MFEITHIIAFHPIKCKLPDCLSPTHCLYPLDEAKVSDNFRRKIKQGLTILS